MPAAKMLAGISLFSDPRGPMPDADTTARTVFASLNAMEGDPIVILGAVMAWLEVQAEDADEDALACALEISGIIGARAVPVEAMN